MFSSIIAYLKKLCSDPLDTIIEWEKSPENRWVLTKETYQKAAELGYTADQIEIEALERTGSIW